MSAPCYENDFVQAVQVPVTNHAGKGAQRSRVVHPGRVQRPRNGRSGNRAKPVVVVQRALRRLATRARASSAARRRSPQPVIGFKTRPPRGGQSTRPDGRVPGGRRLPALRQVVKQSAQRYSGPRRRPIAINNAACLRESVKDVPTECVPLDGDQTRRPSRRAKKKRARYLIVRMSASESKRGIELRGF